MRNTHHLKMYCMRSIGFGITLAVVALAAESCIKEGLSDDCNGRVVIAVRDTNYDNAAEVGDAVLADNLPMRDYIATLVTWDHPRGTDAYTPFEEPLSDTQLTHPVSPQHLSRGVNELSAVGRGFTAAMLYSAAESSRVLTLHPGGQEGEDIYLGGDAVEYPRMDDRTVWMMRTKGKLMVDVVGVPDAVRQVELSVGGALRHGVGGTLLREIRARRRHRRLAPALRRHRLRQPSLSVGGNDRPVRSEARPERGGNVSADDRVHRRRRQYPLLSRGRHHHRAQPHHPSEGRIRGRPQRVDDHGERGRRMVRNKTHGAVGSGLELLY